MRKTGILFPLLSCILLLFQGCFEIVEKIDLHDNGSGSFQFIVNMSKSKTRLNSILKMKTINGRPVPTRTEITQKVDEIKNELSKCKGISNVSGSVDLENYIATVKCSFDKVENLNLAFRKVAIKQKAKSTDVQDSYAYQLSPKIFTRLANFSLKTEYDKLSNADKEVFNDAGYTGIMRFDSEIQSAGNADSKLAADKKAVMLKQSILDIITKKKSIENTITLIK
ncbi:MAG: hypothetical protein IT249_03950 [Chitinophagaceae bacterium]|nr:hypothetical protein [Chitinophagaceae bacterium]